MYWLVFFLYFSWNSRLTQLLEDVQKVLSINIDENDEQTLVKISEDMSTLRNLWTKVRQQNPEQTLTGRKSWFFGTCHCLFYVVKKCGDYVFNFFSSFKPTEKEIKWH